MSTCSEAYQKNYINVGMNVQRLDNKEIQPIIYPRMPNIFN